MPTFAAIDIGSNSVRLKISRLQAGRLKEIHEDREVTRLGEGVFSGGLLSPQAMSQTVRVLRRFHRATQECGTDSVRVVATAALRDACRRLNERGLVRDERRLRYEVAPPPESGGEWSG